MGSPGPIIVAFAGSEPPGTDGFDPGDWITDAEITLKDADFLPGCRVHTGFERRMNQFVTEGDHLATLLQIIDDNPDNPVVLTGHSLGGAVAQLTAVYLELNNVEGACGLVNS